VRISAKSFVGACVIGAVLSLAVVHSRPSARSRGAALSSEQEHAFYEEAADREAGERLAALERFPSSEWSQQDDFHALEGNFIRDYARVHRLPVRGVLAALDRGMRERWPTQRGAELEQRIVPCRPRLSY
jgi:hypothetical protein